MASAGRNEHFGVSQKRLMVIPLRTQTQDLLGQGRENSWVMGLMMMMRRYQYCCYRLHPRLPRWCLTVFAVHSPPQLLPKGQELT